MANSHEPMTYEDLSQLYRQEVASNSLTPVRRDLFKAVATLLTSLRRNYEELLARDPESIICDGANQTFKNAESYWKRIVNYRAKKICAMAIRVAYGGDSPADILAVEEEEYYHAIHEQTKDLFSTVNRIRGKKARDTNLDQDFTRPAVVEEKTKEPVAEEMPPMMDEFDEEPFDQPIPDPEEPMNGEPPVVEPDPLVQTKDEEDVPDGMKPTLIRIMEDLPEFAGPERTYRLIKEDVVTLPSSLAELLVSDGKAVAIRPSS